MILHNWASPCSQGRDSFWAELTPEKSQIHIDICVEKEDVAYGGGFFEETHFQKTWKCFVRGIKHFTPKSVIACGEQMQAGRKFVFKAEIVPQTKLVTAG